MDNDLLKGEVGPAQNSGAGPEPSPPELTCCFALTSANITPSPLRRTNVVNCNVAPHYYLEVSVWKRRYHSNVDPHHNDAL
jgi:hypothetical protein